MSLINYLRSNRKRLTRRALLLVLATLALLLFLLVGITAWVGGRWSFALLTVKSPQLRMIAGTTACVLWYIVWLKRPGQPLPWKAIAARMVLLGLSLIASLFCIEWSLRCYMQKSQGFGTLDMLRAHQEQEVIKPRSNHPVSMIITLSSNNKLIYELRAKMDKRFGDYQVYSNRDGLREERDYQKPKPQGVRRILGIGDSGMFGWDVPQEENYLALLEQALARRSGTGVFEVLNAGVPGYNTQQEVEWLATKGLRFEPEIVIVGWSNNDYDAPFFLYEPVDFMKRRGSLLYPFLFRRGRFLEDAKPHVLIYTDVHRTDIHSEILAGMGEAGARRALARLHKLGVAHDFKVLVFGPMDEMAVALCRDLGLPYFNTYEGIAEGSVPTDFKVHDMHPMVEGHAVLAEHLGRELERLSWLAPSG